MLTTQRLSCFSCCSCSGVPNDTDAVVFISEPIHFPVPCNSIAQLVGPIVVPLVLQTRLLLDDEDVALSFVFFFIVVIEQVIAVFSEGSALPQSEVLAKDNVRWRVL
jgi:hypothetical protein